MKKNIYLVYFLTALQYSWFWVSIWVLFYLRFTDYAGIGILESIMIITTVVGEIPTGAIADLLGKKYTLLVAYFCGFLGNLIMGLAPSFAFVGLGIIIATLAGVFTSGTVEALVYDSLLSINQEHAYQKVLGNISSIKMASLALASILGGLMYQLSPGFPFMMVSLVQILAIGVSLFLIEPPIDSVVFSFRNYVKQTNKGFYELFKPGVVRRRNILIIAMTMLTVMNGHVLIDAQLVAQGWTATQLGIIVSIMFLISSLIGQLTSFFSQKMGALVSNVVAAASIALSMILVPYLGLIVGTGVIMLRNGLMEIFGNTASANINSSTDSKYRATTLSTYSMLANIPYVMLAYAIGYLMDTYSVNTVTASIGVVLLFIAAGAMMMRKRMVLGGLSDRS